MEAARCSPLHEPRSEVGSPALVGRVKQLVELRNHLGELPLQEPEAAIALLLGQGANRVEEVTAIGISPSTVPVGRSRLPHELRDDMGVFNRSKKLGELA